MSHDLTCQQFTEFLLDWLEGQLPEAQRVAFEEHLALCPPCVAYLESYRHVVQLGRQALGGASGEHPPAPGPVPERLLDAILQARRRQQGAG